MERNKRRMADLEMRVVQIDHDIARISDRITELDLTSEDPRDELRRAFTRKRYLMGEKLLVEKELIELRHELVFEDGE